MKNKTDFSPLDEKTCERIGKTIEKIRFSILKSVNIGKFISETIETKMHEDEPSIYDNIEI